MPSAIKAFVDQLTWEPDKATQGALDYQIKLLTDADSPDGKSDLDRYCEAYTVDNQRDHYIEEKVLSRLADIQKQEKTNDWFLFQSFTRIRADGHADCLFALKAASSNKEMRLTPWARREFTTRLFERENPNGNGIPAEKPPAKQTTNRAMKRP